jgi:hypothetical protein
MACSNKSLNASSLRGRNTTRAQATNLRVQETKQARTLTFRERSKHLLQPLDIRANVPAAFDALQDSFESGGQSVESAAEGFPGRDRSRLRVHGIAARVAETIR